MQSMIARGWGPVLALCAALAAGTGAAQRQAGAGTGLAFEAVSKDPNAAKGQLVSWLASSVGSAHTELSLGGGVVSAVALYVVERKPRTLPERQYFAIDKRSPVPVTEAARKIIESRTGDRIVVINGIVAGTVEVPLGVLNPFEDDLATMINVPLIGQVRVDAPER